MPTSYLAQIDGRVVKGRAVAEQSLLCRTEPAVLRPNDELRSGNGGGHWRRREGMMVAEVSDRG